MQSALDGGLAAVAVVVAVAGIVAAVHWEWQSSVLLVVAN